MAVDGVALQNFDDMQMGTLERLFPGLDRDSLAQASLGLRAGGLGYRCAREAALPAALASQISAEPKVKSMAASFVRAGLLREGQLDGELANVIARTANMLRSRLDMDEAAQVDDLVVRAQEAAMQS